MNTERSTQSTTLTFFVTCVADKKDTAPKRSQPQSESLSWYSGKHARSERTIDIDSMILLEIVAKRIG